MHVVQLSAIVSMRGFLFLLAGWHETGSFAYGHMRMYERRSERVVLNKNSHIRSVACCKGMGFYLLSLLKRERDGNSRHDAYALSAPCEFAIIGA